MAIRKEISTIPLGEVLFAGSIVLIAVAIVFSLNSISCVHGGPCGFASQSWGESLLSLPQTMAQWFWKFFTPILPG